MKVMIEVSDADKDIFFANLGAMILEINEKHATPSQSVFILNEHVKVVEIKD